MPAAVLVGTEPVTAGTLHVWHRFERDDGMFPMLQEHMFAACTGGHWLACPSMYACAKNTATR